MTDSSSLAPDWLPALYEPQGWAQDRSGTALAPSRPPAFILRTGDCGVLPRLSHANPSDVNSIEGSFPINTQVTYRCLDGFVKIPGKSDTVVCLPNSQWSNIEEFCGRSCDAPRRLKFAALNKEDETKSIYPVGITVGYTCRPGYEISTEMYPVSTCLENFTWSEVPEFCSKKSCGHPGDLLHGKAVSMTEFLFGERLSYYPHPLCLPHILGPTTYNNLANIIFMTFSFPTAITCPPPPSIANGTSDGRGVSVFTYNSTVTYRCDSGFQLIGVASIRCTTKDKTNGIWSGLPPNCTVVFILLAIDTRGQRGVQFKGNERSRTSLDELEELCRCSILKQSHVTLYTKLPFIIAMISLVNINGNTALKSWERAWLSISPLLSSLCYRFFFFLW
uniref:Sushi domain-containing protein n=1 Tax=Pelusios castaneus TaxID=367368 RepID=A0A8C8VLM9_9SAUR